MNSTDTASLKRRLASVETEVAGLKAIVKRLETMINLISPEDIKVSIGKSQKTTVIQKLNWAFRRNADIQTAINAAVDRLNVRFGEDQISADMIAYVHAEASRIYSAEKQVKTAGEV